MCRKNLSFVLLSLALHAAMVGLFYLSLPHSKENKQIITLEIKEIKNWGSADGRHNKSDPGKGHPLAQGKVAHLKNILPRYIISPLGTESSGDTYNLNPTEDSAGTAWGSGASSFARIKDYNLYHRIYQNVDGLLFYPSILAYHKIQGTVNARLVLNSEGSCDWVKTRINSSESHLRIYVLDVLKKACSQNYSGYLAERKLTNVDFSFRFEISEHDDRKLKESQQLIVGNSLLFYRNSQQSMAEWNIGPFRGIFPIPAVNIDFTWLQLHWDKYINGKDRLKEFQDI